MAQSSPKIQQDSGKVNFGVVPQAYKFLNKILKMFLEL